ncbi:MAG: YbaB/EbfC family nucleoid-associated protein [Lachnospiraceae bacterium]|nr:YbaB/EbfC family nucleoid-associated protein [Lachnospiraceae bacterium]
MAKRGGFPGAVPGGMSNLMKQAQKMQKQMEENQRIMEQREWEATAGGGAVTVRLSGKKEVTSIKIQKDAIDLDDIEMLEDMIMAAINAGLKQMEAESAELMNSVAGGLGNFGGLGGLF